MHYWRRRLPNALASWFHRRHLFLSLQTPDPNFARRLVVLLDAKLEEVVTAFEHSDDLAEAEGVELDSKLKITKLRVISSNTDERERDERLKLPLPKIKNLFKSGLTTKQPSASQT
jgi:hypothetical protein